GNYLIVPSDNLTLTTNIGENTLSISGRDYNNNDNLLYTFYNGNVSDVQYKDVVFCASSLRQKEKDNSKNIVVSPNPFSDQLSINFPENRSDYALVVITDAAGKTLLRFKGNASEINKRLTETVGNLTSGFYTLFIAGENIETVKEKLIKL